MPGGVAARVEALLARHWWQPQPTWWARLLWPLSWLYGSLWAWNRRTQPAPASLPVPLLVIGNLIAGGAGKTPTVIALVQALQLAGHRPGVVSRGHGRRLDGIRPVTAADRPADVGDEPLLIARRCGVPVWVGRRRAAAARALCATAPEVDVLVSDDGLQHAALARDAELIVFDERGIGNGLLLPSGPLREPMSAHPRARQRVLYTNGRASTAWPGALAQRSMAQAWPLAAWLSGDSAAMRPLAALRGRALLAVAGLAAPEKFFSMLQAAGLDIARLPCPTTTTTPTCPGMRARPM